MRLAIRRRTEEPYVFSDWSTPRRRGAVPSFLLSLAVHSSVVAALWQVNPRPAASEFQAPTVEQLLAEDDRRIYWYAPDAPLPAVAPVEPDSATPSPDTPRYEFPQRMTANAPDPQSVRQMIVSDDPSIEIQQDLDLPNMLSWEAPEVARPRYQLEQQPKLTLPKELRVQDEAAPEVQANSVEARLQQQQFEELARIRYQAEQQRQAELARTRVEADAAPSVEAAPIETASLSGAQFDELARLRYQGPTVQGSSDAPRRTSVEAGQAPTVASSTAPQAGIAVGQSDALSRIRYNAGGGTPNREQPAAVRLGTVDAAPAVGRSTPGEKNGTAIGADFQELARLRYRGPAGTAAGGSANGRAIRRTTAAAAAAPSAGGGRATSSSAASDALAGLGSSLPAAAAPPSLGAPGGDQSGGTGGERNLVVAGVNPADRLPDELPRGSRRGRFSAGPDGGRGGDGNPSGDSAAGLRVPNLAIEGPRRTSGTPGRGSIGSDLSNLIARRPIEDVIPPAKLDVQFDPREINIENPFVGRPVYKTAINMPNVTSYRGDWVIQFAELIEDDEEGPSEDLEDRAAERPEGITPPYPVKKVDPRYVADARREELEGEVILYGVIRTSGKITDLTLVRGVDKLLDDSAMSALEQWVFEPARKDGSAVAVETLVRIPFRLDPSIKVRY